MWAPKHFKVFFLFALLTTMFGCVSDLDFDQAEDLVLTPIIESSFLFYELDAEEVNDIVPEAFVGVTLAARDTVAFNVFNDSFLNDNLIRADIVHDTDNTLTNEDFEVRLIFVDDAFVETVQPITISAPANQNPPEVINSYQGEALEQLKLSTQVITELVVTSNAPDVSSVGIVEIRSKATLYLEID